MQFLEFTHKGNGTDEKVWINIHEIIYVHNIQYDNRRVIRFKYGNSVDVKEELVLIMKKIEEALCQK